MSKKWLVILMSVALAGMLVLAGCAEDDDDTNPTTYSISVTSPSASANWLTGTPYSISWTDENVDTFAIDISVNGGTNYTSIATNVVGNTYLWTVANTPSTNCKIRVKKQGDDTVFGTSGAFVIARPALIGGWNATTTTLTTMGLDSMTYTYNADLTYEWFRFVNILDVDIRESGTYYVQGDSIRFHATVRDGSVINENFARKYSLSQSNDFLMVHWVDGTDVYDMNFDRVQ